MSTVGLNQHQLNQVLQMLRNHRRALSQPLRALEATGVEWQSLVRENFANSRDPYGNQWAPLRVRRGQPLLHTGHLARNFRHRVAGDKLIFGSNVEYGKYHDRGIGVPRRQILPDGQLPDSWFDALQRHMHELIERNNRR